MSKIPFEAPKNVELECFATILDMMQEEGVSLVGFKGVNFKTGKEVLIPSQGFANMIMLKLIRTEDFLKLMGSDKSEEEAVASMKVREIFKDKPFGSTDS